nr:hypothetical protein [Tanacetum cinerariifolium]
TLQQSNVVFTGTMVPVSPMQALNLLRMQQEVKTNMMFPEKWSLEALRKELERVLRMFKECLDHKGKELHLKADMDEDVEEAQAKAYNLDLQHAEKVLSMQDIDEEEPAKVEEVLKVVKSAKLMTKVVTTAQPTTTAAQVSKANAPRRRRGVVIQDPEETSTSVIVHSKVQSKDKGEGILIEEPKPLKGQTQIDIDEAFARQLEAELNANINWNDVVEQVKRSEKQSNEVMRYQALKRKPLTEAQANKNMMIYLKNMAGFKMDFFKVQENDIKEESNKRQGESLKQDITKKERMDEEAEELKRHLQIMANDDDALWKLVKERFETTEPKNFSNDFLLNILKIMFEKPNIEASVWKDQKGGYRLAKKYPLTHFTLQQMLDNVRLEVKEESEMSL